MYEKEKDRKARRVTSAQKIPDSVYKDTLPNDELAGILDSRRKVIYYVYPASCDEANLFLEDFEKLMKSYPELKSYYIYHPDPQQEKDRENGRRKIIYGKMCKDTGCRSGRL